MPVVSIMSPENNQEWATSGVGWRRLRSIPCGAQPLFAPCRQPIGWRQWLRRLETIGGEVETARALVAVQLSDSTRFERPLICGEERSKGDIRQFEAARQNLPFVN